MNLTNSIYKKCIWLIAFVLFNLNPIFGQNFFEIYPAATTTTIRDFLVTSDGFDIISQTDDIGGSNPSHPSLIKINNTGNFQSFETFDQVDLNDPFSTEQIRLTNGNYLLSVPSIDPAAVTYSGIDYRIESLSGSVLNSFSVSLPTGTFGRKGDMAEFPNGDLLVSYYYGDFIELGNPPDVPEKRNIVFVRISTTGQIIWQTEFVSQGNVTLIDIEDVVINEEEEIFVLFREKFFITDVSTGFVAKVMESGLVWREERSSPSSIFNLSLTPDSDIWFKFNNSIQKVDGENGANLGIIDIETAFTTDIQVGSVTAATDGGALAFGLSGDDLFTVRLDATGTITNATIIENEGTIPPIFPWSVSKQLISGNFIISGRIDEPGVVNYYPFLLKVDENGEFETTTGTEDIDLEKDRLVEVIDITKIEIYPNPASKFVNINLENTENLVTLKVVNLMGEEMKLLKVDTNSTYQLDLSDLNNGPYLLWIIEEEKGAVIKKMTIARY